MSKFAVRMSEVLCMRPVRMPLGETSQRQCQLSAQIVMAQGGVVEHVAGMVGQLNDVHPVGQERAYPCANHFGSAFVFRQHKGPPAT